MGKQNKYKGIFLYLFGSQGFIRSSKITGPGLTAVVSNNCPWPSSGWLREASCSHSTPEALRLSQCQGATDAEGPDLGVGGGSLKELRVSSGIQEVGLLPSIYRHISFSPKPQVGTV